MMLYGVTFARAAEGLRVNAFAHSLAGRDRLFAQSTSRAASRLNLPANVGVARSFVCPTGDTHHESPPRDTGLARRLMDKHTRT